MRIYIPFSSCSFFTLLAHFGSGLACSLVKCQLSIFMEHPHLLLGGGAPMFIRSFVHVVRSWVANMLTHLLSPFFALLPFSFYLDQNETKLFELSSFNSDGKSPLLPPTTTTTTTVHLPTTTETTHLDLLYSLFS